MLALEPPTPCWGDSKCPLLAGDQLVSTSVAKLQRVPLTLELISFPSELCGYTFRDLLPLHLPPPPPGCSPPASQPIPHCCVAAGTQVVPSPAQTMKMLRCGLRDCHLGRTHTNALRPHTFYSGFWFFILPGRAFPVVWFLHCFKQRSHFCPHLMYQNPLQIPISPHPLSFSLPLALPSPVVPRLPGPAGMNHTSESKTIPSIPR